MLMVKEIDYRSGDIVEAYLFRTEEGAKAKVKEIIEEDRKRNSEWYEELLTEEFDNSFEALVNWFWENGEMEETFYIDTVEFEEDKER